MAGSLKPIAPVLGYAESASAVTATNSVQVGTQWGDDSGNMYVYVYNAGPVQISQGQFAVLATGVSGYSVTASSTTFMDNPIGVAKNATLTTATYGWLMYRGFTGISTENVSFTTAQAVMAGLNGNFQAATTAAGSFVTAALLGRAIVGVPTQTTCSTAANNNSVWINIA